MPCAYCCVVGANTLKKPKKQTGPGRDLRYNGIDRVDSRKGYFLGNLVPCCDMCNYSKNDYTLEEFIRYLSVLGSALTVDVIKLASRLESELGQ